MAPSSTLNGNGEQSVNPAADAKPYARITMRDWCARNQQPYREIAAEHPSVLLLRPVPKKNAKSEVFQVQRPTMFAGRASGVSVVPDDGFLCTDDNHLIHQGLGGRDYNPKADLGRYWRSAAGANVVMLALGEHGPTVSQECIFFGGNKNFGHFVFQNLLRLALLNWLPDVKPLPIAVYDDLPRRYLGFLDILGFPDSRRITIPQTLPTRFDRIWMLSSPMYRLNLENPMFWPDAAWWLRLNTAHLARPTNTSARPRLYIPRGAAEWRRLINEPQVLDLMAKYSIDTIDPSALDAEDQIRAVSNAELIVTVLGAASAITAFAPSDCVVIEIAPPNFAASFGPLSFAAMFGQPHFRVIGEPATAAQTAAAGLPPLISEKSIDRDFFTDCQAIDRQLQAVDAFCRRQPPA